MTNINERGERRKSNQTFTGQKMDWLTAVWRNAPPSYFMIGYGIANHINGRTGKGYPTQEWLAELTRLSVPTVKRAVKFFEKGGWLAVERKYIYDHKAKKWKTRNVYSMDFQCVQDALDGITVMRHGRRKRQSVTSDRSITGDTQTPSKIHTKRVRTKDSNLKALKSEASESEAFGLHVYGRLRDGSQRELPLKRVFGGGR
jgi:hypothetical protein